MELIFVRHGRAEEQKTTDDDAQRKLTSEGRKRLNQTMPSLGLFIRHIEKALIWTSPLLRAAQTADIIGRTFAIPDLQTFDFIADGNFADFCQALQTVKSSATVIVVGHEPHLGTWCNQLCSLTLPFKKGSAAGLKVTSFNMDGDICQVNAELLWFYQPQTLARLGENLLGNRLGRA